MKNQQDAGYFIKGLEFGYKRIKKNSIKLKERNRNIYNQMIH